MNRILLILLMCFGCLSATAQYANINFDLKTISAMTEAFAAEVETETYYTEQVKKILDSYTTAEASAATVFSSKFLDRKALTTPGVWGRPTENYYHKRIYQLVSQKMAPKILAVAKLMVQNPENALYWGSYLMRICQEIKDLCMEFEAIVTCGRMKFSGIGFYDLQPKVKELFQAAQQNLVNWERLQQILTAAPAGLSRDKLQLEVDKLYKLAVDLADKASVNAMDRVMKGSSFNDMMAGKASGLQDVVANCGNVVGGINKSLTNQLKTLIGTPGSVNKLLYLYSNSYNISGWLSNFADKDNGQYYTQRWYIYARHSGKQTMCNYEPPADKNSVENSTHWYRINTSDIYYMPPDNISEYILRMSELHAGWSRDEVNRLNAEDSRYKYTFTHFRKGLILNNNGKMYAKAFAHSIRVDKTWDWTDEVHEAVFDSYSMDMTTFQKQLQVLLNEFNQNEQGIVYQIGSDNRNYYSASNAEKLKGAESVIVTLTCFDSSPLATGNTSYKCRHCKGSLTEHTKQCAMLTSIPRDPIDTSELDAMEREYQQKIATAQTQINTLESRNTALRKQLPQATPEGAAVIRQQITTNQNQINSLKSDIASYQNTIKEIQAARQQMNEDKALQTDDYYRIPAIMNDCATAYDLTWDSDGFWRGYTYTRQASSTRINGGVTFQATLKITRKPQYFLGIQIHRAIVQIEYRLTAEYYNSSVADVIALDPTMSDRDKEKLVNDRLSAIARDYPECELDTQYITKEPTEDDKTRDTYHLLWASDRLEIARGVDARLHRIYADLICIEKMMNYKRSIVDVLLSAVPPINDEQGKRQTIVEQARRRWLNNAAKTSHSGRYNGKYEDIENRQAK